MKSPISVAWLVALSACAAPAARDSSTADIAALREELTALRNSVDGLANQVGHLQSNVDAASADDEFSELGIDSVRWASPVDLAVHHGRESVLLCHPTEWRGWGKLMRFTRQADAVIYLEAEGHPSIEGRIQSGGICNSDGSLRLVYLDLDQPLESGVSYRLRPRNQNEHYRWIVGDGMTVAAR